MVGVVVLLLILPLVSLDQSGRAGPLPIEGNELLCSLVYRSHPQLGCGALLQAAWVGAEGEMGEIWPDSVWSRAASPTERRTQ